jgi:hypothetical protein
LNNEQEQRLANLRADQAQLASIRDNLEHELEKKYIAMQEKDSQDLAEAKKVHLLKNLPEYYKFQ